MTILPKGVKTLLISLYITLKIGMHKLDEPIKWASGTWNPFYVNNRIGVSNPETRKLIRIGLAATIENKDEVDYIYGIPTGGIAPATLLALEIGKPILIKVGNNYFSLDIVELAERLLDDMDDKMRGADVIAGTIPLGIILGIIIAEELNKPFLYVRPNPKGHGTGEQVEGMALEKGSYALLVDPVGPSELYTNEAVNGLKKERDLNILKLYAPIITLMLKEVDVNGKTIVTTEDLVSTASSGILEMENLINLGATIWPRSIFDYGLPEAKANFKKYGLKNVAVFNFKEFMEEYKKTITPDIEVRIWKWYENQSNWGDLNGHPRTIKE